MAPSLPSRPMVPMGSLTYVSNQTAEAAEFIPLQPGAADFILLQPAVANAAAPAQADAPDPPLHENFVSSSHQHPLSHRPPAAAATSSRRPNKFDQAMPSMTKGTDDGAATAAAFSAFP